VTDCDGLIDTAEGVAKFMDEIADLRINRPSLYMDMERDKLAYGGHMWFFQIRVASPHLSVIVVFDIKTLGAKAFKTGCRQSTTLRNVLESSTIPKIFHCVSNDQAALKASKIHKIWRMHSDRFKLVLDKLGFMVVSGSTFQIILWRNEFGYAVKLVCDCFLSLLTTTLS
jgi:hypothetical protein